MLHARAELRHKDTPTPRFRARVRELAKFLIYEATRDLETEPITRCERAWASASQWVAVSKTQAMNPMMANRCTVIPLT